MRTRSFAAAATLCLVWLALASCADDITQPMTGVEQTPSAPDFAIASNTWIKVPDMPTDRYQLAAAAVKNASGQFLLYTIGGRLPEA